MKMMISLCVVTTLVLACVLAQAKAKKPDLEARKQFKQGIALYEQEKYEQASIAFERAYELKPSYKLLFNIGQVENQLEHYAAAYVAYSRYLEEGGSAVKPKRKKKVLGEIERLETLVGYVTLESPVDGAKVKLDKEVIGSTPLTEPVLVDMGKHEVLVESEGEVLLEEIVKIAGGATVALVVEIKEDEPLVEPIVAPEPSPPDKPKRVWTWVAGGVGAAAGIAAAISGGVASSRSGDLEKNCEQEQCPKDQWETLDSTRNLATTTNVLIGVAAAGVAAGVVLFFVEPRLGREEMPVVAPIVTDEGAALSITGRF